MSRSSYATLGLLASSGKNLSGDQWLELLPTLVGSNFILFLKAFNIYSLEFIFLCVALYYQAFISLKLVLDHLMHYIIIIIFIDSNYKLFI